MVVHFNEDADFYPTIPTGENFDIYPHSNPMSETQGAGNVQPFNALGNGRNLTNQRGPLFNPYCKHRDHLLVDYSLTCCLQIWRSRGSNIRPRAATTLVLCMPANICQRSNPNHSPPASQDQMVLSPLGRPQNHLLFPRPPATARFFSASHL